MKRQLTLHDVLESKEQRHFKQQQLLSQYNSTLVTLTVNIMGQDKLCNDAKTIFDAGVNEVHRCLPVTYSETLEKSTGYEGFFLVAMSGSEAKERLCQVEEQHPLGRLFDMDVHDREGKQVSRSSLGKQPRKCLLCDEVAVVCTRNRAHTVQELKEKIHTLVQECLEV